MPKRRWLRHDNAGSTALQFALVALPLFLLIIGIIESSLLFWSWQALEGASVDAGRCAALNAPLCGNPTTSVTLTQTYAANAAVSRGLDSITASDVTVLTGAPAQAACGNSTASVISVAISYKYPMISFVPLPSALKASACFPLSSS